MSFILDALQKADAERARGHVPSLHAHHVSNTFEPAGVAPRTKLIAAVVGAIAATALASWMWLGTPPPAPVVSAPAVVTPAPASTPVPSPLPTPAPSPLPLPQPQQQPHSVPPIAPARYSASVAPPTKVATTTLASPKPAPTATQAAAAPVRAASSTKPATTAAQTTGNVVAVSAPLLAELPEDIRRQIPAMAISGAVYSDNPAQRLLLVNGQVLTQGSQAAPDVTLVEIRPTSSVFNFRGTQFRLGH